MLLHFLGTRIKCFIFISFILLNGLISCRKTETTGLPVSPIEAAKLFFASKVSSSSLNSKLPEGELSNLQKLNDVVDWSTASVHLGSGKQVILVDIRDKGLAMQGKVKARRMLGFLSDQSGKGLEMSIIELFGNINEERDIYSRKLLEMKGVASTQFSSTGLISDKDNFILYDDNYSRVGGTARVVRGRINNSDKPDGMSSDPREAQQEYGTGLCQTWGVYLVILDLAGNEIESVLLYTFNTGDCNLVLNAESIPPDYGGSQGLNEDIDAQIAREFARACAFTSVPENIENYNEGPQVNGVLKWIIAKGSTWHVEALTQFSYSRIPYRDVNTLQLVPEFSFSTYKTLSSSYIGTNMLVETTWTQTAAVDDIYFNGSNRAYAESFVRGTLSSKWKGILGSAPLPDNVDPASNRLVFRPK